MFKNSFLLVISLQLAACQQKENPSLNGFELLCELVASEAKPIGFSSPMLTSEIDNSWEDFEGISAKYGVMIFRETDFPVTRLFPSSVTQGKEVIVVSKPPRLVQYHQFKSDLATLEPNQAARRLGRLLGYTASGTNELLMKNSDFRTLESFQVNKQITHLYYQDLEAANEFYESVLGLSLIDSNRYAMSDEAILQLHTFNEDHPKGQEKSTAIAFLTDQLSEWYEYMQKQDVPIKYTYKPREAGPHDGFVAIDPGGYLLEFEQFKQHPENELFMAYLKSSPRVQTQIDSLNFYGSITWTYHNDLLMMQQFYEEVLGFQLVADQGWTKIYRTSSAGFIGLVDERRGMMDYSREKAVEIEWQLSNSEAIQYFSTSEYWNSPNQALIGPENYSYLLR
ncbi:MAG: VOC family protein [Bacteroidota bacterium]